MGMHENMPTKAGHRMSRLTLTLVLVQERHGRNSLATGTMGRKTGG